MSFIPKYILKRMIPEKCVKGIEKGGIEISMVNVLSPLTVDEVPDNVLDYIEAKIDGKLVPKDIIAKIKIEFEGQVITLGNAKSVLGKTLPVGGTLKVTVPELGLKKGEEHEINVIIKTNNPIDIKASRVIQ
jgi:hypothetical protein